MNTRKFIFSILLLAGISIAQETEQDVLKKYSINETFEILEPFQSENYAVGIQAKGKLANVLTNFGELSSFHVASPSLEWPAFGEGQDDEQLYGWGVDLMIGYQGDVIESFQDPASNLINREWQPANENLFSGNVTVSEDDQTPIMATSDNSDTWPVENGSPFWPGLFRSDTSGNIYQGEFTSERDLYCVYTDEGNTTPYGLRVEQTAYSFSRRYAEDFLVFRFNIMNTSANTLEDIYPGMMIQFLIDFDNKDLIDIVDSNNDGKKDMIYMWDADNIPRDPWSKVGYIGLVVINTPYPQGITNFHYFHDDFIPTDDDMFWRLLTSDTTGLPDTTKQIFFHGDNLNFDDVSLAAALDPDGNNAGAEITWAFSSGPVTLTSGDSLPLEIAIVCGDNKEDLFNNVQWIWDLYSANWNGPNPPSSPNVKTFPGNNKITITWDAETSENSRDNITGERDFEGYKIYRSTDQGKNWGRKITDSRGNFIGFEPLAQFDLVNEITGNDPISNRYLGNDSGIRHTFNDTTVTNGIEYWYAVTAYDKGEAGKIESLESALGITTDEINIAAATSAVTPVNFNSGNIANGGHLEPESGTTDGQAFIEIIDPSQLKTGQYKVVFNENTIIYSGTTPVDTTTTFTLSEINSGKELLKNHILTDASGDNIPVIDGFRLNLIDSEAGIKSIGWETVNGDTSTFDWYTDKRTSNFQEVEEEIVGFEDFKIVVVDTSEGSLVTLTDGVFGHAFHSKIKIPIKVYTISDPDNPVDVSEFTEVFDLRVEFPSSEFLGPLGWDLIPGGAGYNPFPTSDIWPDLLALNSDTSGSSHVWIKTQNGPADATPPSLGDEFVIRVAKPFNNSVVYTFTTTAGNYEETEKSSLSNIRVVPNPYFVTSALNDQVMFTNLPASCDIKIFNVVGDLIKILKHRDLTGTEYWDLKNEQGLAVAYGLYVYVVKADGVQKTGKFSIIR